MNCSVNPSPRCPLCHRGTAARAEPQLFLPFPLLSLLTLRMLSCPKSPQFCLKFAGLAFRLRPPSRARLEGQLPVGRALVEALLRSFKSTLGKCSLPTGRGPQMLLPASKSVTKISCLDAMRALQSWTRMWCIGPIPFPEDSNGEEKQKSISDQWNHFPKQRCFQKMTQFAYNLHNRSAPQRTVPSPVPHPTARCGLCFCPWTSIGRCRGKV